MRRRIRQPADASDSGFTVTELLVALAIVGILLAILIPAVQSAREASRRTQCINHLRQIGIAVHGFESSKRHLPRRGSSSCGYGDSPGSSVHSELLGWLDQPVLAGWLSSNNCDGDPTRWPPPGTVPHFDPIGSEPVPVFRCPSDPSDFGNNYRFCIGTTDMQEWNGAFGLKGRGPITLADITDGLSQTAAVSEKIKSPLPLDWNPRTDFWCTGLFPGYPAPVPNGEEVFELCGRLTGTPIAYHTYTGFTWLGMGTEFTDYNHIAPPNSPIPDCAMNHQAATATPYPYSNTMGPTKATSYHPGGVNLLFVDGHVEFKSNSIDLKVWRALATRAGREQL